MNGAGDRPQHEFIAEDGRSLLLIVDIQQAMLKAIDGWQGVTHRVNQLSRAAAVVGVPVVITEHYKKGLGETIEEVTRHTVNPAVVEKIHFSACLEPEFLETIASYGRKQIILTGMESHVCVLQTGLNLIHAGYQVQLVADAVGSRSESDRETAVGLFRQAGAVITCTETVIFQWARRAGTERFRELLQIVK